MKSFIDKHITNWALNLSRPVKWTLVIFLDMIICIFAFWLALSLRLEKLASLDLHHSVPILLAIGIIIPIPTNSEIAVKIVKIKIITSFLIS